jgi:transcriptional regulator with XRE-family HTH domain
MPVGAFAELLRQARERLGKSQNQLALDAGEEQALINKVESGKRLPTRRLIQNLAPVLSVAAAELQAAADADALGFDRVASLRKFFDPAFYVVGEPGHYLTVHDVTGEYVAVFTNRMGADKAGTDRFVGKYPVPTSVTRAEIQTLVKLLRKQGIEGFAFNPKSGDPLIVRPLWELVSWFVEPDGGHEDS